MSYQNSQAGGQDKASCDVCKTPPFGTPANFENTAQGNSAVPNVHNVLLCGGPAHNQGTITPSSQGDEGGSYGGVASGVHKGSSRHATGSQKVFLQGMAVTRLNDTTLQNNGNTTGSRVLPSQCKVQVLS